MSDDELCIFFGPTVGIEIFLRSYVDKSTAVSLMHPEVCYLEAGCSFMNIEV